MTRTIDRRRTPVGALARLDTASRHLGLMVALTFVTGLVDAGGYLGLDRVFVGNMTGNVVILGMGAAGADGLPVLGPALALGTFVLGAGIAGLVMRSSPAGWSRKVTMVAVASIGVIAGTAILIGVAPMDHPAVGIVAASMTACAMGMQAASARKVGVADVTTVVVTSTITVWATDMFARPSTATILNRRLAAIGAILVGALAGALLEQIALWLVFAVAAGIGSAVVAIGHGLSEPRTT